MARRAKASDNSKKDEDAGLSEIAEKQEHATKLIEGGAAINRVDVPSYYGTSIQASFVGNDLNLVLRRPHPVNIGSGMDQMAGAILEPQVAINMSASTAKDLLVVLQGQLDAYETKFGVIETEFTRSRADHK